MSEEENYLENEEDDNEYKPIFNNEGEENKNDDDKLKNNFGNTQSKISKKESEMSKNDNIFLPQVNNSQQSSKKSENKDEMFMENEEVDDVQFKNDVNNEEMKKNEDENSENKEEMFVDNEEVDDVQFKNDVNNEEKSKNSFEEVKKSNLNDNKSNLSSKKSENKSKVSSKKDNESEKKSKLSSNKNNEEEKKSNLSSKKDNESEKKSKISSKKDNESEKKSKISSNKNNEEEKKSNLSDKKSNKSSKKSNLENKSQIENQKENEIPLNNSKLNLKKSSKKHLSNKSQLQNPIKNPNFLEISQNSSHHTFNLPIIPIKDNSLNKSTNSKLNNKSKISTPKNNINNDQDFLPKIIEPNINNKNINEINSENNKINSENNKINDDILIINKQEKTNEPLETCNICGYVDTKSEFTKQTLKLEHLKHLLIPEITKIVQNQLEEYDKKRKEEESKKEPPIDYTEKLNQLETMLISLATATKSLQANFGINPDNSEQQAIDIINKSLKRKLKNMNKIATLAHNVDNSFETDNKFTITHTFKQEYLIIYPNLNYGIDEFNLSSNLKKTVVSNAHESNIICMKTCQNNKKNLTYLASASYDRKLKIFSVENGYKLIKEFKDVHKDYSIFALDMIYDENDGVIILSGNSNTNEIKICFVDDDNNNENDDKKSNNSKKSNKSNKSKKSNNNNNIKTLAIDGKLFCINHNEKISDKFFVGTNKGIIIYKLKTLEIEKIICEKDDVSNHLCICFLKNINNILIEGNNLGKIKIWDLESNELIKNIERGILKNQVNSIDYWSDEYVIAGYRDGKIILIDVNNGKAIDEIGSHESYVYTVKTAEHWKYGKIIVSSGFDKKLKLFGNVSDE